PYFLAVKGDNGIIWMVPLSSQVDKYREKEKERHRNVLCYIGKFKGRYSAFLTGNIIPVTNEYVQRPFTVKGVPFVLRDKKEIREIESRVRRYLALVRAEKLVPAVDILSIEKELLNRVRNS
ncbi:MAG: hypothetical protein LUG17_01900, partial [Clostridiales bacterium]|nr:hypothetical protein [Clostridiales bacterium]